MGYYVCEVVVKYDKTGSVWFALLMCYCVVVFYMLVRECVGAGCGVGEVVVFHCLFVV